MWRAMAVALAAGLGAAMVWLAGFTAFEREARLPAAAPAAADGIVALTGGAERIETALRLLEEGKAPRLLVSGVGRGAEPVGRLRPTPAGWAWAEGAPVGAETVGVDPRIVLGRDATDTVGNAAETAAWARRNGMRRLIVVTAGYHMARALREIARKLPEVTLQPVPVRPAGLHAADDPATLRLLATEYDKLLAARLGIHRFPGLPGSKR